jgi:DNA-binding MarR family transcriptional regulator
MDGNKSSEEKWGAEPMRAGFTLLPNHFLALNQFLPDERQMSPTEMLVLLQILSSWWSKERLPFPSKATIATRSGLSPRQVQRALTSLENKGFIARLVRYNRSQARASNQFDLTGLTTAVAEAAKKSPSAFKRQAESKLQVEDDVG